MTDFLKYFKNSLFAKIIIVFFGLFILLAGLQMLSHQYFFKQRHFPKMQRNSSNYCSYLIEEMGFPPDTIAAEKIAENTQLGIRIEGRDIKWASQADLAEFKDIDIPAYGESGNIRAGFDRGLYVDIHKNGYRYLFVMEKRKEGFRYMAELHLSITLFFSTLFILLIYLFLRWQLKPIRTLHTAVKKLQIGNLDFEIPAAKDDELGALIKSFNQMIAKINSMLRARDQLLLDVSHELRSPLTRMKVAMEFIDECEEKANLENNIRKMETMIAEILETERLNSPHGGLSKTEFDLIPFIKDISADYSARKPGIKFLNFPDMLTFSADRQRLQILLRNILDNALKFSAKDGYPVEISLREKHDEIIIEIQDFGRGIPETELPFVFEPFYRIDKSRSQKTGGYGLGMSMSRKIMEAHDGSIDIASKEGTGTTVFLKFRK